MDLTNNYPADFSELNTPCYVIDEDRLRANLEILADVQKRGGCKILLAQKAFSAFSTYPLIAKYLAGTTASGLFEARLGYEEMGARFSKETHIFSPCYPEKDFDEILKICDHIVFNNLSEWARYREKTLSCGRKIEVGLRINPEYSEIETDIYNPCFANSRLGTTLEKIKEQLGDFEGIDGLHFHTMCEQGADVLERTLAIVEEKFSWLFDRIKWLNFGGGHHITRSDYDIEKLIMLVKRVRERYGLEVYLEPGEAVALNAGWLVASVLGTSENGMRLAILDASASCHMPDVLEMPYRPKIIGAGESGEKAFTYRLGGNTCLAGDVIGDYSFDRELEAGDRLVFCDMAIYSMCKNNTFNGIPLPSIAISRGGKVEVIKEFGYDDFKRRL